MRRKVDEFVSLCSHRRAKLVRLDPYEKTIPSRGVLRRDSRRFMGRRALWPDDAHALQPKR